MEDEVSGNEEVSAVAESLLILFSGCHYYLDANPFACCSVVGDS
jgi:hypothetical protein